MHKEILNTNQVQLLPVLKTFSKEFYMVGGTAIALHIGHRRSIDFDLFKYAVLKRKAIIQKLDLTGYSYSITRNVTEQINVVINHVKFTFFQYPFNIKSSLTFENSIKIPSLIDLAAMKAYALGRRAKWKDYVDLYFIIKDYFTIKVISNRATEIFEGMFSEKQFRAQLAFHKDIDYSEPIEYLIDPVSEEEIKEFLIEEAIKI